MTNFRTLALLSILIASTSDAGNPTYVDDGIAARKSAAKLPSMRGVYIDPCESPAKLRRWWKRLATPELEEARVELELYRNAMDCKGILIYDVPSYTRENEFWKALDAGDAAKAKEIGAGLRASAEGVVVDDALVSRRLAQLELLADELSDRARKRVDALLRDARSEARAKRYVAANLVIDTAMSTAFSAGAKRPLDKKCTGGADPTRGC